MRFREVELLPICGSKHKKRQRTHNLPLRKVLAYYNMENNLLRNNNNSYLKYIRIDKLLSEYKLALSMPKKKMGVVSLGPVRGIMGLASYTSKPPITEPNMPPQQEKKDNKKDEKKRKKPVIKVDGKTTQELEKDLLGLEPENYRYQWGVKLIETPVQEIPPQETETPKYILQNSWGVKVKKVLSIDDEFQNIQISQVPSIENSQKIAKTEEFVNVEEPKTEFEKDANVCTSQEIFKNPDSSVKSPEVFEIESKIEKIAKDSKKEEEQNSKSMEQDSQVKGDTENVYVNKDIQANSSFPPPEDTTADSDYNVPKGLPQNAEIIAWQDLVERSKSPIEEVVKTEEVFSPLGHMFSPEPPEPKLDIEAVKSADGIKSEEKLEFRGIRSMERKKSSTDYASSKRIHTDSHLSAVTDTEKSKTDVKSYLLLSETTDIKKNLIDPFMIKNNTGDKKTIVAKCKGRLRKLISKRPRLPTKILTLTKINTDDMTYYNALEAKRVEEIYGRMVEIELSSPNGIGDNVLDGPLPTEITISMKTSSKKKVDSMSWAKCAKNSSSNTSAFNSNGVFGGSSSGSSGSHGRKKSSYLHSSDVNKGKERKPAVKAPENEESDDEVENYAPEGDYIRVPGDPYPYSREHFYKWRVSRHPDYQHSMARGQQNQIVDYNTEHNSAGDYNLDGYATKGYNAGGYNSGGYNSGYNADGNNANYNPDGYNVGGFNAGGYNAEGYKTDGYNSTDSYRTADGYATANRQNTDSHVAYREEYSNTFEDKTDAGDYAEGQYQTQDNYNYNPSYNKDNYNAAHGKDYTSSQYTATTEYTSHETEEIDEMDEDDQEDYYTRTMAKEAEEFDEDDIAYSNRNTSARDNLMKRNIYRSKNRNNHEASDYGDIRNSNNSETAKYSEIRSGENLDVFRDGNRSLDKKSLREDAGGENVSKGAQLTGPDMAKVYEQQTQNLVSISLEFLITKDSSILIDFSATN